MTKENLIKSKSFEYSLHAIKTYKSLVNREKEYTLSKQLLKSATSVGAMVRESEYAQSRADFINKLCIGQKECNESLYWIELLYNSDFLSEDSYRNLMERGNEVMRIISKIIVTSKENMNDPKFHS